MTRATIAFALLLSAGCAARGEPVPAPVRRTPEEPPAFVVVHGAWGGGWAWAPVAELLEESGHAVHRPTLTGLGERVHLATPATDLTTHITDVLNHLVFEGLHEVILVGHSYGGMVAMAVADRAPDRIRRVVLLDAFLPEDGESALTAARGTRLEPLIAGAVAGAEDGRMVPSWTDPRAPWPTDVPQPLRTFTEPVALRNPAASGVPGTYILTVAPGSEPADDHFAAFAARAEARGWEVLVQRADHNPQNSARRELAALLREIARDR